MRTFLCLSALLFSCFACSQPSVLRTEAGRLEVSYWQNGNIRQIKPQSEGKTHGLVKTYYENGRLLSEVPYHYGIPHGTVRLYSPQGVLDSQVTLIAGKVHGPVISFYTNGIPREELHYYMGRLSGQGYEYYDTGVVAVSTAYSNWIRHGEEIVYNQSGWPLFEVPFQFGVEMGVSNVINYKHTRMTSVFSQDGQIPLSSILAYKDRYSFSWPVMGGGLITYNFGMRVHPVTGVYQLHSGVDIAMIQGQPILAAAEGRVVSSGWAGGYGITVKLDHETNFQTLYGHLSQTLVETGDQVRKGQIIGYMGRTGKVTGVHLHFEVRISNVMVDPMLFYRQTQQLLVKNNQP